MNHKHNTLRIDEHNLDGFHLPLPVLLSIVNVVEACDIKSEKSPSIMDMNMKVLNPSRKKVSPGDIFVLQMKGDARFIFGRVININAMIGPMKDCILIYIYNVFSNKKEEIPLLSPEELLVAPIMTNRQPWIKGYFETIKNITLMADDILPVHCFKDHLTGGYFDEQNNKLPCKKEPCGEYGLDSYSTIDDAVSESLGILLATDE